ncbi:hypothetical protein [Shimia sp. SDUM112013]|uniref:hypothetical protein n=1 Tax=Shimia sp. SDUM112013 TaxID=3136160 RepID=UPI0032F014E6
MPTKAELEEELKELRKLLAEKAAPPEENEPSDGDGSGDTLLGKLSIEDEVTSLLNDLDDFPHKSALLFALGVFALGFMAGRGK